MFGGKPNESKNPLKRLNIIKRDKKPDEIVIVKLEKIDSKIGFDKGPLSFSQYVPNDIYIENENFWVFICDTGDILTLLMDKFEKIP